MTKMNLEDTESLFGLLERVVMALEIIAGIACDDCERIFKEDAYDHVCDNPPERNI